MLNNCSLSYFYIAPFSYKWKRKYIAFFNAYEFSLRLHDFRPYTMEKELPSWYVAWKDIGGGYTAPRSRATNIAYAITHVTADTVELYLVYFSSTPRAARFLLPRVPRILHFIEREPDISNVYTYVYIFDRCISHLNVTRAVVQKYERGESCIFIYAFFTRSFKYPTHQLASFKEIDLVTINLFYNLKKIFFFMY